MSMPLILDITIGLIFIYLILSLLASEIQELITTILQWRAVHLKKSIEILVAGDAEKSEAESVVNLVNDLYNHPLIKSINQEAKGTLTTLPRRFIWLLSSLPVRFSFSGKNKTKSIFGYVKNDGKTVKHSAPSYIPAKTFATTLIETLGIPTLVQKLTESRLINFKNEQLNEIQKILLKLREYAHNSANDDITKFSDSAYAEFLDKIEQGFGNIIADFQKQKANLVTSMNRMAFCFDKYIDTLQLDLPKDEFSDKVLQQLRLLKQNIFDNIEETISLNGLQPNINEVFQLINVTGIVYKDFENEFTDKDSEAYQTFKYVSDKILKLQEQLPDSVLANMIMLAKRAYRQAKTTQEGLEILQTEIESTFDNSMARAAGVYKRNSKGVALLIGFAIAILANADAFHIVSRLSKDSGIRTAIVNTAGQILENNPSADLVKVKKETDQVLTELALPIGWTDVNLEEQFNWKPQRRNTKDMLKLFTAIPGWIVSAIAISMGAPFWFDLLGKIVNVRNTGKPPASSTKNQGDS